MSKIVNATVAIAAQAFPAGTVPGNFVVDLIDAASGAVLKTISTPDAATSVAFPDVGPGTYTVAARRVDAGGAVLGTPAVSDPFTIDADGPVTVSIDVPSAVTVALA